MTNLKIIRKLKKSSKKRGRKPKNKKKEDTAPKIKKRGRKPKGGKL